MFGDLSKSWICETAETQNLSLVLNTSALPAEGGGEVGFKCLVSWAASAITDSVNNLNIGPNLDSWTDKCAVKSHFRSCAVKPLSFNFGKQKKKYLNLFCFRWCSSWGLTGLLVHTLFIKAEECISKCSSFLLLDALARCSVSNTPLRQYCFWDETRCLATD